MGRRPRAVVAGGAGFLGSHLCERLLAEGYEVLCLDDMSTGSVDNIQHLRADARFGCVRGDVTAPLPEFEHVDAVLHLASPASPRAYQHRPVETLWAGSAGTRNLLELARRNAARFLFASTSEVYGDPLVHPQPESYRGNVDPTGPRSVYDEAKRFGEALTAAYRTACETDTAIVRIFNSYGPRMRPDDGRMIPTFVTQALHGAPLTVHGDGRQTRSLCYVDDTVDGLVRLLRSGHAGPVNIGSPRELTVLGVAEMVRARAGSSSPIVFGPPLTDDPRVRCPDITLARTLLGWEPRVLLEDGLMRTLTSFRGADGR